MLRRSLCSCPVLGRTQHLCAASRKSISFPEKVGKSRKCVLGTGLLQCTLSCNWHAIIIVVIVERIPPARSYYIQFVEVGAYVSMNDGRLEKKVCFGEIVRVQEVFDMEPRERDYK